jgi:hypothetical protein
MCFSNCMYEDWHGNCTAKKNQMATEGTHCYEKENYISEIVKWKNAAERRSASVPVEYLIRWPENAEIYCYDFEMMQGRSISSLDDLRAFEPKNERLEYLKSELAKLEAA